MRHSRMVPREVFMRFTNERVRRAMARYAEEQADEKVARAYLYGLFARGRVRPVGR